MKYKILIFLGILLSIHALQAQIYFYEDFESGNLPPGWDYDVIQGDKLFTFTNGGGTICQDPECNDFLRFPLNAAQGNFNALLFEPSYNTQIARIITPVLGMGSAAKPQLFFFRGQEAYGPDFDKLRLYYKLGESGSWHLLKEYLTPTEDWAETQFFLPDSILSDNLYLAFEGETDWGHGLCVDSITIEEKGIIPYHIKSFVVNQSVEKYALANSDYNPILRVDIDVFGNTGALKLDSLKVLFNNTDNNDIKSNGVRLFVTDNEFFSPDNQITAGISVSNNQAAFSNINYDFSFGKQYVWVTADVKSSATHGNQIDASFNPNDIHFSLDLTGALFNEDFYIENDSAISIIDNITFRVPLYDSRPNLTSNPAGNIKIAEAIFFDDFEGDTLWSLSGDFEISTPMGLGGIQGNPDPEIAYSGTKVMGNDLSGKGVFPGDYETGYSYAVSPVIDCQFFKDIKFFYKVYLNKSDQTGITARIEHSFNNGNTWNVTKLFNNLASYAWQTDIIEVPGFARQDSVMIRFVMGNALGGNYQSGWNIDDFSLVGDYLAADVSVSEILEPVNGCLNAGYDSIKVVVRNLAGKPTPAVLPIGFSINGGVTTISDTIHQSIGVGDSLIFTFSEPVNFQNPGIYDFKVFSLLDGDEDLLNDTSSLKLIVQPNVDYNYTEDFSENQGLWFAYGDSSIWKWGNPAQKGIPFPPEDPLAWVTNLIDPYPNEAVEYVESPCFDFSYFGRGVIHVNYYSDTQEDVDGMKIQFSHDGGQSWNDLDTNDQGYNWGWYTDSVDALGGLGWSGNNGVPGTWVTAQQLLPDSLRNFNKVKFRMQFASDTAFRDNGVAFDDFKVFPTPIDLGVSDIISHKDTCINNMDSIVLVSVKNFGYNAIGQNDTIIVGFDLEGTQIMIDSFYLHKNLFPDDTAIFTLQLPVVLNEIKSYYFRAYTLNEERKDLLSTANDTLSKMVTTWPIPDILLPEEVLGVDFDSIYIGELTENPDYTYKWDDGSTDMPYQVFEKGYYYFTVTDAGGNGCRNYDSVWVELFFNDVGVDSVITPVSSCEFTEPVYPVVRLRNFGNDTLHAGDSMNVGFILDGVKSTEKFILDNYILSGQSINYTFKTISVDLSSEQIYALKFFTDHGIDTVPSNDSVFTIVETYGFPQLTMDPVRVKYAYNDTLDAGSGYTSYLWDNASTNQKRVVTQTGEYSVTVTDENGCSDTETTFVRLIVRDIRPVAINNPVNGCENTVQDVEIDIRNNGNDTIKTDENVMVHYSINGSGFVSNQLNLDTDWLPGTNVSFVLIDEFNPATTGIKTIRAVANRSGDLNVQNDTIQKSVTVNALPEVRIKVAGVSYSEQTVDVNKQAEFIYADVTVSNPSYLWSNGATGNFTLVGSSGVVTLQVTDQNQCVGSTWINLQLVDAIENEMFSGEVLIYPNPAKDNLSIQINDYQDYEDIQVRIITMDGRVVLRNIIEAQNQINYPVSLEHLPDGFYQIEMFNSKYRYTGTLIVR